MPAAIDHFRQRNVTLPSRIVVVDDTPEIAELLGFSLKDHGFDIVSTGYTDGLCDLVEREGADAVVLDCSVLAMSESLFDQLRDEPSLKALPVVMISDTPEKAVESLQAREASHVLLVPKPFSGSQVARALTQLLKPDAEG